MGTRIPDEWVNPGHEGTRQTIDPTSWIKESATSLSPSGIASFILGVLTSAFVTGAANLTQTIVRVVLLEPLAWVQSAIDTIWSKVAAEQRAALESMWAPVTEFAAQFGTAALLVALVIVLITIYAGLEAFRRSSP